MPSPSTPRSDVRLVRLGPEHRDDVLRVDQSAFGFDPGEIEASLDTAQLEWDRTWGAVRPAPAGVTQSRSTAWEPSEDLAGIYTAYSLDLTVPGRAGSTRTTPMAGLSWVSVHPDHRRRGVMTAMLRHHLQQVHDDGVEAVSGLYAAEPAIYQRFGYGEAAGGLILTIPRGTDLRPSPEPGAIETWMAPVDAERDLALVHDVFARSTALVPGLVSRPEIVSRQYLVDRPQTRIGTEPDRLLVAYRDGRPSGYALLHRKLDWSSGNPSGRVEVSELYGVEAATLHALWSRVLDLDLTTEITTPHLGLDDPLLSWLLDSRAARPVRKDCLWLRLVDVDRALEARGYACDLDVVIEVEDEVCPWNARRWHLRVDGDLARCTPTEDPADLTAGAQELAAAYVGGHPLAAAASAGLVHEHRPGAVALASQALRGPFEPAPPYVF
jgi:predicted acetyltransferase